MLHTSHTSHTTDTTELSSHTHRRLAVGSSHCHPPPMLLPLLRLWGPPRVRCLHTRGCGNCRLWADATCRCCPCMDVCAPCVCSRGSWRCLCTGLHVHALQQLRPRDGTALVGILFMQVCQDASPHGQGHLHRRSRHDIMRMDHLLMGQTCMVIACT